DQAAEVADAVAVAVGEGPHGHLVKDRVLVPLGAPRQRAGGTAPSLSGHNSFPRPGVMNRLKATAMPMSQRSAGGSVSGRIWLIICCRGENPDRHHIVSEKAAGCRGPRETGRRPEIGKTPALPGASAFLRKAVPRCRAPPAGSRRGSNHLDERRAAAPVT